MGRCAAGRDGTGQYLSAPARDPHFRRGGRRRHFADARHARDPPALSDLAQLCRRQGDQPRGRPPRTRQNAGSAVRASGDFARHDQHVLFGGAVAGAQFDGRRHRADVARGGADRHDLARVRAPDHRSATLSVRALARADQLEERQSDLRPAGRARALSRRPQISARPGAAETRRGDRGLRSRHCVTALPGARAGRVQGEAHTGAVNKGSGAGWPADCHPFPWRRPRARNNPQDLAGRGPVPNRSSSSVAGDQARARQCQPRLQPQRLSGCALAVPLRDAHAAERDQ